MTLDEITVSTSLTSYYLRATDDGKRDTLAGLLSEAPGFLPAYHRTTQPSLLYEKETERA